MADSIERIADDLSSWLRQPFVSLTAMRVMDVQEFITRLRALSPAGGLERGCDWYEDEDTGSIIVDFDFVSDHSRQLSLILKANGEVAYAAYINGTRMNGADAMTPEFYSAIRMLAASPQQEPGAVDGLVRWDLLPSYLIDHCEGDTISEEGLQHAVAAMLRDPKYSHSKPTPADESGAGLVGIASIPTGGDGATTRALFDARTVPPGTKLYASGQTLAGAGVLAEIEDHAGHVNWCADKLREHGFRVAAGALDETATLLRRIRPLTATSAGATGDALPELPEPEGEMKWTRSAGVCIRPEPGYDADQMREYARRAREVG